MWCVGTSTAETSLDLYETSPDRSFGLSILSSLSEMPASVTVMFMMNSPFQRTMGVARPLAGWIASSHGSGRKVSCTASQTGVTPRRSRRPVGARTPLMVPDAITFDISSVSTMESVASPCVGRCWPLPAKPSGVMLPVRVARAVRSGETKRLVLAPPSICTRTVVSLASSGAAELISSSTPLALCRRRARKRMAASWICRAHTSRSDGDAASALRCVSSWVMWSIVSIACRRSSAS